jgi:LysR family glycine cleavage system transcriptional activator
MVADMLEDGRLIEPFSQRIEASESFYLVRGSGTEQHPDAVMFATWLVEQAHRFK